MLALLALVGCVWLAHALVGGYMVWSGNAAPGNSIFLDELAPTLSEALLEALEGLALIGISLALRAWIRRKRLAGSAAG